MNELAQNIKFTKTFRTEVLLFNEATNGGTTTFVRYYFNDIIELNGKQIVGFSVDLGYNAVTRPATITNDDFTKFTQGANYSIATEFDLPALFLNLYNDQKELILDNFPALLATGFKPHKTVRSAITEIIEAYRSGSVTDKDEWHTVRWMSKLGLGL